MPRQTDNYKLGYYVAGELTDQTTEERRFKTVDMQLRGLYEMIGNGVQNGWDLSISTADGFSVTISSGKGIVSFLSLRSTDSSTIGPFTAKSTAYLYAVPTPSSYWDGSVSFVSYVSGGERSESVYLGRVDVGQGGISSIDTSGRKYVGFLDSIRSVIQGHHHTGTGDNPEPVDLGTEVQGYISQINIPALPADIVKTGVLDKDRIPKIDHRAGLTNNGLLTHAQLDTLVQNLLNSNTGRMGETLLSNFLQLVLALKHQWPDIDEYLYNLIAFIPGISPDSMIDSDNTTALVDTRTYKDGGQHKIYGVAGASYQLFTKTWDTKQDFEQGELYHVIAGNDSVFLQNTSVKVYVDDFEDVSDWNVSIIDASPDKTNLFITDNVNKVQGTYSGKLDVGGENQTNLTLVLEKKFTAQDWSNYDKMVFYLYCDNPQHGDIFFYVNDVDSGTQTSNVMLLEAGDVTINQETLMVGWREYVVDISTMDRTAIDSIGFYTSTSQGWDSGQPMLFNIDEMYLTTGNKFLKSGYLRLTYGDAIPKDFYGISWESLSPASTIFRIRTRMANDVSNFDPTYDHQPAWANLLSVSQTSGTVSNPTGELYKYIQIEAYFEASPNQKSSPELYKLNLQARNVADLSQFIYDTKEQWQSGTLTNIDTTTYPGSITIGETGNLDDIIAGTSDGAALQMDSEFKQVLTILGGSIPRSTAQVINDTAPSFGQISAIELGENSTLWIADTTNDRVLNIDKNGNLLTGFYGSFLKPPVDNYGKEERGPGSNIEETLTIDAFTDETTSQEIEPRSSFDVIQAVYNPKTHILYMVFDAYLKVSSLNTLNANKVFLSIGANRIYLTDSEISMVGVDAAKYEAWMAYFKNRDAAEASATATSQTTQATDSNIDWKTLWDWYPHILQAKLPQSEYAAIDAYVNSSPPTVYISNVYENKMLYTDNMTVNCLVQNTELGGDTNYQLAWQLDGQSLQYTYLPDIPITGLTEGEHLLKVFLVDENRLPFGNIEASAYVHFIYSDTNPYPNPHLAIRQPKNQQKLMSSTVGVVFSVNNFIIAEGGTHIRYVLDDNAALPHYTYNTIVLKNLSEGEHTVRVYLADVNGDEITSGYSDAEIKFYVQSEQAALKLFVEKDFMDGVEINADFFADASAASENTSNSTSFKNTYAKQIVDISNIHFTNLYSPIDIKFVQGETSDLNPTGKPCVLVAKLRSESSTEFLNGALPTQAPAGTTLLIDPLAENPGIMYDSIYADGHSVIQLTTDNELVFSNNAPKFAKSKTQACKFLGSTYKLSPYYVVSADAIRKRGIITLTDYAAQKTFVAWEYDSDRYVSDIQPEQSGEMTIKIYNDRTEPPQILVRRGTRVTFENYATNDVYVYSGDTSTDRFNSDPDLNLFGDDFQSAKLAAYQTGKTPSKYSVTLDNRGSYNYFVYPNITEEDVVGQIIVQETGATNQSNFLLVENDPTSDFFGNRIIKVDTWGNIIWSFGEGLLYNPKDIRPGRNEAYLISV